ncbi:MAG: AAA family ATPase, partial [Candidatus Promineifilaceae bacterium]|nr:AAA family ATPase [Candidatus Promineifilaceae bacterium]
MPRKQARALLYKLAASPQPAAKESLVGLFWLETEDRTARKNLSRLVSYLRHQLPERDLIAVDKTSISLNHGPVWSDVLVFEEMCSSGDLSSLESAVRLYRGPFLTGFTLKNNLEYERWHSQQQRQFERLYLSTLAKIVVVLRQKGDYQAAIRYAQQYLETDDLAEEIHRELITLYAMAGNRAAVLKQYETCVEVLERELGVSPLPETDNAFELAVRGVQGKPAPAGSAVNEPNWILRPSLELPLIGRETTWHELESAYQQNYSGGVILIAGEAGIGKTRLIQEFATTETRTVLTGNNHVNTQALPYYPLIQVLRQALRNLRLWSYVPSIWLSELQQILPEIRTQVPNLPPSKAVDEEQAQARLLEAITQVFFGLASQLSPILLCLDDLHWADNSTLSWLAYISPRLAKSRLCIIGAYRQEEQERIQSVRHMFRRS